MTTPSRVNPQGSDRQLEADHRRFRHSGASASRQEGQQDVPREFDNDADWIAHINSLSYPRQLLDELVRLDDDVSGIGDPYYSTLYEAIIERARELSAGQRPACTCDSDPTYCHEHAALGEERLADILVDLEMDGLFGPSYVPRETAAAIIARLATPSGATDDQ